MKSVIYWLFEKENQLRKFMSNMNRKFFRFFTLNFFLMQKISFLLCGCLSVFTSADDDLSLMFLKQFVAHRNFDSPTLNIISCRESGDINLVKLFSGSLQKFVTVRMADEGLRSFNKEPQTFILDLECSLAAEILKQAESLHLLRSPFKWLLLARREVANESKNFSETKKTWSSVYLDSLNLLIDSDIKIAEKSDSSGSITITGVYKIQKTLMEESLAEWSSKEGFVILNSNPPAIRRWNLQGMKLSASVVLTRPNSIKHVEDMIDKHVDTTSKVSYNVVKLFGDIFNISINFIVVKEWGEVNPNGSWTGMIGNLQRHETDFGAAPVFFRKDRMSVVEYYAMVTPTSFKFLFLSPPLSYSSNIFLMPFDTIVWYCCFGMVAVSCSLLYMAAKFEKAEERKFQDVSLSEILILNIGAICLQGTVAKTKKPSGRIITLFAYLAYMFLYISYSAAIVAILQSSDKSIQTLTDFLKSPLEAGADDVPYSRHYFQTADDEVRKAIYRKKIAPKGQLPHFLPVEEGIKKLRKGFYGYHVEVSAGYQMVQKTFTEEEKCGLQELSGSFIRFTDPWLVVPRKSPFAELFKIGIKRCIERGFKSRFVRRFYTKKPSCASKSSRFVSVGMTDCYHAFMLLFSGTVLAVSIMILEISFRKNKKKRKGQNHVNIISEYKFVN